MTQANFPYLLATFFVLLTRVRKYPTLLGEVIAAGHEVALFDASAE